MGVKFFGHFLLEQGLIKSEQLLAAVLLQESRNRPLGLIAVDKGYLSSAQVEEIHRRQRSTDRRFGELALALAWMSEEQVQDVLKTQRTTRICIGEALVELGYLSEMDIARQLQAFERDQEPYQLARVQLPPSTPHAELVSVSIDLTEKLLLRAGGLSGKRGVITAIERQPPPSALLTVLIPFSGAVRADYAVSASRDVAFTITRRMLGSAVTLCDEIAGDALREFCNLVCGNICAKLSHAQNPLEIGPPEEGVRSLSQLPRGIFVPMHIPDGRFELRLHFAIP